MISIELARKKTDTNGMTAVVLNDVIAAGFALAIHSLRYVNRDTVAHVPTLELNDGTPVVMETGPGTPAGGVEKRWCSKEQPIHLAAGETIRGSLGEPTTLVEGYWHMSGLLTEITPP